MIGDYAVWSHILDLILVCHFVFKSKLNIMFRHFYRI